MNSELFWQSEIATMNDERLTRNGHREILENYMVIRVKQKDEKKNSRPRVMSGVQLYSRRQLFILAFNLWIVFSGDSNSLL